MIQEGTKAADEISTSGRRRIRLRPDRCETVQEEILSELASSYYLPFFKEGFGENLRSFPEVLKVPRHYLEEICALSIGSNVSHYLKTPRFCLNFLSLWQVIEMRDWSRLEEGLRHLREERIRELKVEDIDEESKRIA